MHPKTELQRIPSEYPDDETSTVREQRRYDAWVLALAFLERVKRLQSWVLSQRANSNLRN